VETIMTTFNTLNDTYRTLDRLQSIAICHEQVLDSKTLNSLSSDISSKLYEGWSVDELVRYHKNCEEVNPGLSEDIANSRMDVVREKVIHRLSLTR
jgi:hypothetical protein